MQPDTVERVTRLFGGASRARRRITSPEGVVLDVELADRSERLIAFLLDLLFLALAWFAILIGLVFSLGSGGSFTSVSTTISLLLMFLVRMFYFTHFELAWQGCTPGKRICGLKVIDRKGGALLPGAVVARNLTREVETFMPIFAVLLSGSLLYVAWMLVITLLPLFNRDRLRGGDLIAGTMVIALPRRKLSGELAESRQAYQFKPRQLQIYGAFELQVLEELLRRPRLADSERALADVASRICQKIGWTEELSPSQVRGFLEAFYTAERAELERGKLFGRLRADKNDGVVLQEALPITSTSVPQRYSPRGGGSTSPRQT
ncbi:MAG: RDD family protein [Alphaproteobacteria bacterium]|nr:RDD family protein [Alphaproteobacteria bacterium]